MTRAVKFKRITVEEYADYRRLKAAEDYHTATLRERFRIKSDCDACGYQSMDLRPGNACPLDRCHGGMKEATP